MLKPFLKNHPDHDAIFWRDCDKETYEEIEEILTKDVVMYDPFMVDNFFSEEDFNELKEICTSHKLKSLDYNQHLQKWEQQIELPEHLINKALDRIRKLVGTEDIHLGYYFYTHFQLTEDGRRPRLPLHIDYSQGAYMIGLVIDKNKDWEVIAQDKIFNLQPNQAYISQPQHDYHWRPKWDSEDPNDYHSILLFHLINHNNWSIPNDSTFQDRPKELNDKFPDFGPSFISNPKYVAYRMQQRITFDPIYIEEHKKTDLPLIPWEEIPTYEDSIKEKRVKNIGKGD